jgi:hypothetical protein
MRLLNTSGCECYRSTVAREFRQSLSFPQNAWMRHIDRDAAEHYQRFGYLLPFSRHSARAGSIVPDISRLAVDGTPAAMVSSNSPAKLGALSTRRPGTSRFSRSALVFTCWSIRWK